MKIVMIVIGTRPEAIKLFPVIRAFKGSKLCTKNCIISQHTDLLAPLLVQLDIKIDHKLDVNQASLQENTIQIMKGFAGILNANKVDLVVVQGDTTTAFAASLASYYAKIPIAHIEAGLRTGNLNSPWPEELHRYLIDKMASYFFAPTFGAYNNLIGEGISKEKVWLVGNTSIDAVRLTLTQGCILGNYMVVTIHRRENHGDGITRICEALLRLKGIKIKVLLHPNPNICKVMRAMLSNKKNIELTKPMNYVDFIYCLNACSFILTDSGGIQEEASFLAKPVLIARETTERTEIIEYGIAELVGSDTADIVSSCNKLIFNEELRNSMSKQVFPFGDGYASEKIVNILNRVL